MDLQLVLAALGGVFFGGGSGYALSKKFGSDTAAAVDALKVAVARVKAAKAKVDAEQGALLAQVPEIVKGL